jgi:cytochrome c-type biogenesis protein CcmH
LVARPTENRSAPFGRSTLFLAGAPPGHDRGTGEEQVSRKSVIAIPIAVFVLIALGAMAFVAGPLFVGARGRGADAPEPDSAPEAGTAQSRTDASPGGRRSRTARLLLAGALAVFVLGIGGGTYWMTGRPGLALRDVTPPQDRDLRGLLPLLVKRVRQSPGDVTGWAYLGRAYMNLRDPGDAAKTFAQALSLLRAQHRSDPELFAAYGEALVEQNGGTVGDDAAAAFTAALAADPKDMASRFYLGMARAERGDKAGATALWQSLLADVPPSSALHRMLVDRIAMLTAAAGGAAPDPRAMVAGLAARLKADPHDAGGWQRLIRAYHVLGDDGKAENALAIARKTFKDDKDAQAAFDAEAKELKLE